MTASEVQDAVRGKCPCTLHTSDGAAHYVAHVDHLNLSPTGRLAIVWDKAGTSYQLIEPMQVTRIEVNGTPDE